jgi:hypothetical protein
MSIVIAIREDSKEGSFIGFQVDDEIVVCSKCTSKSTEDAAYRLRYTSDQRGNIAEHRFKAFRLIVDEHPNHSEDIRIA